MNHPMTDPKQDVRQQFEAWAVSEYPRVPGVSSGSQMHIDLAKERAWPIWQAALQSPAVRELVEALDTIVGLSRALRSGGPDTMDLQELSDALHEAVDTAHAALRTLGAGHVE